MLSIGTPGSPPRMRGKLSALFFRRRPTRITPADAGKTKNERTQRKTHRDHPRGCGENAALLRVRSPNFRITPADAGKTAANCLRRRTIDNHPRGCGENRKTMTEDAEDAGSPPQVRGKPSFSRGSCCCNGITPAGAGKTRCFLNHGLSTRDHPRRCGEN